MFVLGVVSMFIFYTMVVTYVGFDYGYDLGYDVGYANGDIDGGLSCFRVVFERMNEDCERCGSFSMDCGKVQNLLDVLSWEEPIMLEDTTTTTTTTLHYWVNKGCDDWCTSKEDWEIRMCELNCKVTTTTIPLTIKFMAEENSSDYLLFKPNVKYRLPTEEEYDLGYREVMPSDYEPGIGNSRLDYYNGFMDCWDILNEDYQANMTWR